MTIRFQPKSPRALVGAVLAVLILVIWSIWYSISEGLILAGLYLAAGCLSLKSEKPWLSFLLCGAWGLACVLAACALPTVMVSDISYRNVGFYRMAMNFLCVAAVFGLLLTITGSVKAAIVSAMIPLALLATLSGFVYQFRGNLLKPLDLLFAETAMNVVGQYVFQVRPGMARALVLWIWMLFALGCLPDAKPFLPKKWLRIAAALLTAACTAVFLYGSRNITMNTWSNEGATRNGFFLNFAVGIRDCFVAPPEHYAPEAVAELETIYSGTQKEGKRPNILVIMNESYADFEVLGNSLKTNIPVTPFLDSLEENTIRGYALTSIFGGTTANAEFEFLTGFSMANVPEGSCPYQQYINTPTHSLVQVMNSLGYRTLATHPYLASGWNRTAAYPRLGFPEMTFLEDYPGEELVREFVSDREIYRYVLDRLEETKDAPLFLFGITMQNHGDYIYTGDHYEQTVFLEDYAMAHPMAEQYLTLLHESDRAVEELLTALEDYPEDTLVLFFGDHFPQVEGDFFLEVHGGPFEDLSAQMLQYTIPFFIWANYDIPEQTVECTSLSYLGRYLMDAAAVELPPFYRFLKDMEQVIPAMNADGYYSLSQQTYLPYEDAAGEEALWLSRYRILQYNGLFDSKNRSRLFWNLPNTQ